MRFARKSPVLFVALLVGCATQVTIHDVTDSFRRDQAALCFDLPDMKDLRPLRFHEPAQPMAETIDLAQQFLARERMNMMNVNYARALLACSLLAQWRTEEAQAQVDRLGEPPVGAPELQRAVMEQARWAASACRAMEGRIAVDEMVRTEDGLVEFVETYGNYVGYVLPHNKHSRDYVSTLEMHVLDLQKSCFPPRPWGPRKLERRARKIREMRRMLAEQMYNDSATLLKRLRERTREKPHETDAYFAATLSGLYITLSLLSDDLVPRVTMVPAQKQWIREQALSTYEAARKTADAYISRRAMPELETGLLPKTHGTPEECYRRLYARLYIAQIEVLGWITIR